MPTELYIALITAHKEISKLQEQLDKANLVIKHVVYDAKDSTDLAYDYLKQNNLLDKEVESE